MAAMKKAIPITLVFKYSISVQQTKFGLIMGMRKKSDLPSKDCVCCGRPFNWRKKWEKVWDEVKYCSDRCRQTKQAVKKLPSL